MERGGPLPRITTQGEARHIAFVGHAKAVKEMIRLYDEEVEEALIQNQINMMGIDVVDALGVHDGTRSLPED